MPLNSPILSGDISGGLHSTSVDKIKGNSVAAVSPRDGEVLTWNGEAWVPGAPSNGGSGGGGVAFYFNGATAAQSPTTGLPGTPVELGRVADTGLTTITSGTLSEVTYTLVKGFVSDVLDPSTTVLPAGLWDFNLWAASNANAANQTIFRIQIFKYDGANAPTLLATSDDISIYDPSVAAQYIASVVIPQTTLLATDRIYIEVQGRATANNRTITIYTGDAKPSHVHTTIPSVTGTGLVKVVSSVMQSPASLLVDADVASDAAIAQSKISGLVLDLAGKQAALTTSAPLALSQGGTAAIYSGDTRITGTLLPATVRHNSNLTLATAGTLNGATWTFGSAVVTFTSSTATLVPGMSISATGLTTAVIKTVDSATQVTMSTVATGGGGPGTINVFNSTQSSLVSLSVAALDGRTIQVGDIVLLTSQTATAQNGPWRVDAIGTGFTMTRPTWFRGTFAGALLFSVQYGTANSAFVVSVMPSTISTTVGAIIGIDAIAAFGVTKRADCAIVGANTFSGIQTFAANSPTGAAPFKFNGAGTGLNTTPIANQCEWDGTLFYLTTNAGVRTTNAAFVTAPSTPTSTGVAGQIAFDGTSLYVCTATNTWRKATLATF